MAEKLPGMATLSTHHCGPVTDSPQGGRSRGERCHFRAQASKRVALSHLPLWAARRWQHLPCGLGATGKHPGHTPCPCAQ